MSYQSAHMTKAANTTRMRKIQWQENSVAITLALAGLEA
jgi:hypothetical protein